MTKKIGIFYFSSIPYNYLYQRPQQLYDFWKDMNGDYEFFFVDPPNIMMSFNRKFSEKNDYNIITLPLHSQFQLLTNLFYNWFPGFNLNKFINSNNFVKKIAIVSHPLWEPFINTPDFDIICYDCIDSINLQLTDRNCKNLLFRHKNLISKSIVVFVTAQKLKEDILSYEPQKKVILISNGVNSEFFEEKKNNIINYKKSKRKVIGYVGTISDFIDIELIFNLAKDLSQVDFVLVGPIHNDVKNNVKKKPNNVIFIDKRPYAEIPSFINLFDVAIIPFKIGDISESTDPVKLYEYFSLAKPVVATNLRELKKFNDGKLLKLADNEKEFIDAINSFLNFDKMSWQYERKKIAIKNSWSLKAKAMIDALKN